MSQEEKDIQDRLVGQFPFLAEKVRLQRDRRMWVETPAEKLAEVFDALVKQYGFNVLCTVTGLDLGEKLAVYYHLAKENSIVLNLLVQLDRTQPVLQTIINYFPAAEVSERELVDLLGIQVQGLPPGSRYPLTDDWPKDSFPLRKDWKGLEERQQ